MEEEKSEGEEEGDVESSEEEEEEVDPGPWVDTDAWKALPGPAPVPKAKLTIAHKFMTTSGWDVGRVVKKCGALWAVKYPTDPQQYLHQLNHLDYGHEGVWVAVKKGQG